MLGDALLTTSLVCKNLTRYCLGFAYKSEICKQNQERSFLLVCVCTAKVSKAMPFTKAKHSFALVKKTKVFEVIIVKTTFLSKAMHTKGELTFAKQKLAF